MVNPKHPRSMYLDATHQTCIIQIAPDDIGVCADGSLDLLRVLEMHNAAVVAEEVNLLDARDVVYTQALEGVLQALVVCAGSFVHGLLLPSHGTLATGSNLEEFNTKRSSGATSTAQPRWLLAPSAPSGQGYHPCHTKLGCNSKGGPKAGGAVRSFCWAPRPCFPPKNQRAHEGRFLMQAAHVHARRHTTFDPHLNTRPSTRIHPLRWRGCARLAALPSKMAGGMQLRRDIMLTRTCTAAQVRAGDSALDRCAIVHWP